MINKCYSLILLLNYLESIPVWYRSENIIHNNPIFHESDVFFEMNELLLMSEYCDVDLNIGKDFVERVFFRKILNYFIKNLKYDIIILNNEFFEENINKYYD